MGKITAADQTSEKPAYIRALQVAHTCESLRNKVDCIAGRPFAGELPSVIDEANRLRDALCWLQESLADTDLRNRLNNTHADAVSYAGEVAPSYVEAAFLAGERLYSTVNCLCRLGVLFPYASRLQPASPQLGEPFSKILKVEEIDFAANGRGNYGGSPERLLAAICREVIALPAVNAEHARAFLEKETTIGSAAPRPSNNNETESNDGGSLDAKAAALKVLHEDWTDQQIADAIPCARTSLFKPHMKRYLAAKQSIKDRREEFRGDNAPDRRRRTSNLNRRNSDAGM